MKRDVAAHVELCDTCRRQMVRLRTNQILEDMLRACALKHGESCEFAVC
jgi:hypothetical protein